MKKTILVVLTCALLLFCPGVLFAEEEIDLGEIVVTATKTEKKIKDVPVETVVITKKDIENSNAQNLPQLLRDVSGIYIRGENVPGESAWKSKMRGLSFDSGYGLILIDGEKVKGGGMGEYGISLNQIPLDMIEKIEIVKGPASVLYGSDALAGVVNIITKPTPKRRMYGAKFCFGSFNTLITDLNYGDKFEKFGFFLQGNREQSKRSKYGGSEDDYRANHIMGKFGYDFDNKSNLELKVIHNEQHWKYEDNTKFRISPMFKKRFSQGFDLTIKGYWYRWHLDSHSPGFTHRYGPTIYTQAEAQYNFLLGKKHKSTIGAEYLQEDIEIHAGDYFVDKKRTTNSIYLQDEINFEPLTLVLGSRLDDNSQYGTEFNPKASLLFKIKDNTKFRASIGRAFKSPTIRQLYVLFKHGKWWNKPNENLLPEKSVGYSFGVEHLFSEKSILNFTLFRNDINDMVVSVDTTEKIGTDSVRTWENIGKTYTQGMEIQLKSEPIKNLSLTAGYTYLDTKDIKTNKKIPYNPTNTTNLSAIYNLEKLGLNLGLENKYVDEIYKDEKNTKKIKSYSITNLRISKKINNAKISLGAENIFNSDYGEADRKWPGTTYSAEVVLNF